MPDVTSASVLEQVQEELIEQQEPSCVACNWNRYPNYNAARLVLDVNGVSHTVHRYCLFSCNICRIEYIKDELLGSVSNSVQSRDICTNCFDEMKEDNLEYDWTTCHGCDTYMREDSDDAIWSDARDKYLCVACYENYIECNNCGYEYYEPDGHECEEENESDSPYIHNYSYKPKPVFFGDTKYHFGIELEVEAGRNGDYDWGAELCYRKLGDRGYLKYDGSLSNGFEIVSHPHSLQEIQDNFPWTMLDSLKDDGFRSWNTSSCGLHVHVSRSAFTAASLSYSERETHQIKFMKLIYDNQRQVERLAGRKSSYAKFDDKGKVVTKVKAGYQSAGRYSAVNIENDATFEVRVFRGSLRPERVLSGIEFVHAAVEYTRNLKIVASDKPLSWAKFVGYVSQQSKTYPHLFLIMNELFDKEDINQPEEDN